MRLHRNRLTVYIAAISSLGLLSPGCLSAEGDVGKWGALPDMKLALKFTITSPSGDAVTGESAILFSGKYALSTLVDQSDPEKPNWSSAVLYDLERMAWHDNDRKAWIDMASCRAWEKASIEKTRESLASSRDAEVNAFVEAAIDPRFNVQLNQNGTLTISNSHLTYSIIPDEDFALEQTERYFAYDRLNAFHKALTEKQLPPTAQLEVDNILLQKQVFPKQMNGRMLTRDGYVRFKTEIKSASFQPDDANRVALAVENVQKQ